MPTDPDEAIREVHKERATLQSVAGSLERDRTERRRADRIATWALVIGLLVGAIDTAGLVLIYKTKQDTNTIAHRTDRNVRKLNDLASIIDPSSPRGRAAQVAAAANNQRRLEDSECRMRRAVAGLPKVPSGQSCLGLPDNP